jgi:hypothetical protein
VNPAKPFAVTGIDFAGPLYIKVGRNMHKAYVTLFTCATTQAVHLELCTDMSTDKFLTELQRFAGRRGLPHTIYTDNARTFQAVNIELSELWERLSTSKTHQFLTHNIISWKFIAPRTAVGSIVGEDGGHYETLSAEGIGAVKTYRGTVEHHFDQH